MGPRRNNNGREPRTHVSPPPPEQAVSTERHNPAKKSVRPSLVSRMNGTAQDDRAPGWFGRKYSVPTRDIIDEIMRS
jgi:hypothetical protein